MNTNLLQLGEDSPLSRIKTYFDALQNSADEYLFAMDFSTKQVMLSKNFVRDFNFPDAVVEGFDALLTPFVWHDDREILESAFAELETVNPGVEIFGEFRLLNRNGEYGWVSLRMTAGADEFGQPELVAGVIARMDVKLKADHVTGLLNRNSFHVALMKELNSSPDAHGAVILIGLDNFQLINETYGFEFGDNALRQLAQDITNILPPDIRLVSLRRTSQTFCRPIFASTSLTMTCSRSSCRRSIPKRLKLFSQAFSFVCAKFATLTTRFTARRRQARRSIPTMQTM